MCILVNKLNFLYLLLFLFLQNIEYSSSTTGPNHGKVVVCYIGTWAVYRPNKGSFSIEHVEPSLCTHLVYSFVGLNTTHDSIRSLDPWQDLSTDYGKDGFGRITKLRLKYPHLKVTVAIGGWNEGSINYSKLVSDPSRRGRFVVNALEFVRKYNFDGLDLDWEFPGKREGSPNDKENFVKLVKELRAVFDKFNLLLTAAFGAGKDTIDIAYDVKTLSKYLDYVHLMCYDYHGSWDQRTGANAPLQSQDVLNVEYSVKYMIQMGMDPSKLVMGIPLYGRTFKIPETSLLQEGPPKLGTIAESTGFQGPWTRENGFLGYNEICLELQNETYGWKRYWDSETKTPFLVNNNKVVSYDDEESITEKVKFAMKQGLAGAMVWSIDTDDFLGDCSKIASTNDKRFNNNFPLMRTINEAIVNVLQDIEFDKENEIPDEQINKNGSYILLPTSVVLFTLLFLYIR